MKGEGGGDTYTKGEASGGTSLAQADTSLPASRALRNKCALNFLACGTWFRQP